MNDLELLCRHAWLLMDWRNAIRAYEGRCKIPVRCGVAYTIGAYLEFWEGEGCVECSHDSNAAEEGIMIGSLGLVCKIDAHTGAGIVAWGDGKITTESLLPIIQDFCQDCLNNPIPEEPTEHNLAWLIKQVKNLKKERTKLIDIENRIKAIIGEDPFEFYRANHEDKTYEQINELLAERADCLNRLFHCTPDDMKRIEQVNETLLGLCNSLLKRVGRLYRSTVAARDEVFDVDYEFEGKLRVSVDFDKNARDEQTDVLNLPDDDFYGSDFYYMAYIIQKNEQRHRYSYSHIFSCHASFNHDNSNPTLSDEALGLMNELDDGQSWMHPFRIPQLDHLCICYAIHDMLDHHNWSWPDLLRINSYWADAKATCQRITDQKKPKIQRHNSMIMDWEHPYRIVKLSCSTTETLISGMYCKGIIYKFPKTFRTKREAEKHLKRHISRRSKSDSEVQQLIGYLIQETYVHEIDGDNLRKVYRQWSYAPDGRFLAEAYINGDVEFKGCEPQTLPFRKGDYVIACYCGVLLLGRISAEPDTPAKVIEIKSSPTTEERWEGIEDIPVELIPDALYPVYVADFIDGLHGLVSIANVFPLPFDISAIPSETIASINQSKSK